MENRLYSYAETVKIVPISNAVILEFSEIIKSYFRMMTKAKMCDIII